MNWENCEHEWVDKEGMSGRDVICTKCQCPGERDPITEEIYYPTT